MQRCVPCAPSNRMRFPRRNAASSHADVSMTNGASRSPNAACSVKIASGSSLVAPVGLDDPLLDRHDRPEFRAQRLGIDQVAHPDPEASDLVLEDGPDASQRRAGPQVPLQLLLESVEDLVVRHDDVGPVADAEVADGMATLPRLVDLLEELRGLDDHPVPDQVHRPLAEHARRQEVERVQVLAHLDGVPGVRAALETHDDVRLVREEVDDLALALVPELAADGHGGGHGISAGTTTSP